MIDSSQPNQPIQNYEIVNDALELQVAKLLPSVAGYGGNLRSTNTIIPIIDLTSSAEGGGLSESLQTAVAFGSQTAFDVTNTTTTIINNTGFFRVFGVANMLGSTGTARSGSFRLTDGVSTKKIWEIDQISAGTNDSEHVQFDFVAFFAAGESMTIVASTNCQFVGSTRQIATIDGTLVNPSGF